MSKESSFDGEEELPPQELEQELRLGAETVEVMMGKLGLRDEGSISEKSKRLLRTFASQVISDRNNVSPSLLYWIALSIGDYVTGAKPSLDAAFRLKKRRGRPQDLTPNRKWEMCEAYTQALHEQAERHGFEDGTLSLRLKAAEHAAYKALYGVLPDDSKADKGSIDDGLTRVRKVLKEYGFYISPN